ncbi:MULTISPECIES: heme utilization cystosolic carrier protein HutX [Pasteurellaceae]|uniref:heme utilization cystosolic carrier protein HutX n=1 Tax=Pasteurellaceae TaxID=712 RepID=UPI000BA04136|nr:MULTISPECIES: heme utilization cystosolic carrier protein HutX [Pasteurellaceae]RZN57174.1 heme utilization cystosolic carrier protein HutX [Avibacterium paragallinarum]TID13862.1 heme iron utilization protein [Avibacterium paragallinarum]WAX72031.1 heme utilization cystosolic carrier protein HutX [Gallibacterium anatis]
MTLQQQIAQVLESQPDLHTLDLAEKFQLPEGKILKNLPPHFVSFFTGQVEALLAEIHTWGEVVTIIEKAGSIFEISGVFPQGKIGYGYFNLNMDKQPDIALHGHLKLDRVKDIALISKPFRGKESYAIAFITEDDNVLFKIYLGRDTQRQLFPHQVEKFNQLKNKEILC